MGDRYRRRYAVAIVCLQSAAITQIAAEHLSLGEARAWLSGYVRLNRRRGLTATILPQPSCRAISRALARSDSA